MAKNKILRMEHIWFVLTIVIFVYFIVETVLKGIQESYVLLILSFITGLMFLWRKALRKKDN